MFLQLVTLAFAASASDNANRAADLGNQTLKAVKGSASGGDQFLSFEDFDYKTEWKQRAFFEDMLVTLDEKVYTKTSIPVNSIKRIVELDPSELSDSPRDSTQASRIKEKHKNKLVLIRTFSEDIYYLDCSFEEFNNKLYGKRKVRKNVQTLKKSKGRRTN